MMSFFRKLRDVVVFGNFFIALCTYALFQYTYFSLNGDFVYGIEINCFILLSSLASYNICRLSSERRLKGGIVEKRISWVSLNKTLIKSDTVIFVCLAFYSFWFLSVPSRILVAFVGFLTLLYTNGDIRRIPYLKIFIIVFCWLSICVGVPVLEICIDKGWGYHRYDLVITHFLEILCFLLAITLPFDIRDYDIDRSDGIKTIPHLIGVNRTICFIALLMLTYIYLIFTHSSLNGYYYRNNIRHAEFIYHCLYSLLIILLGFMSLKKRNEYFYLVYVDGVCLLPILSIFL